VIRDTGMRGLRGTKRERSRKSISQ